MGLRSRSDQTKVQYPRAPRSSTIAVMTRYMLRVYSGAGYHPDRGMRSLSRRRVERSARVLEREGFATQILTLAALRASAAPVRPST
jgi:hypothetical protein